MKQQKTLSEIVLRLFLLVLGLYILAQGIAFTILADLGVDAITSPALVAHKVFGQDSTAVGFEFCTIGNMLICVHILLVFCQIILLRSKFKPVQLLQIINGLILGSMLDICTLYTKMLPMPGYIAALLYTLMGCVFCAFGIFTFVKAKMVPLSAEGLCLALSSTFKWRFSRVKVAVDCTMVAVSVLASLIILQGIEGVREGTIICAVSIGFIIGWLFKHFPFWDTLIAAVSKQQNQQSADDPT